MINQQSIKNEKVFIETSILIDRTKYDSEAKVQKILSEYEKRMTSTYCKMEFKRRCIGDYIYLYNLCNEYDNLADVLNRISRLPQHQHRKLKMTLQNLANALHDIDNQDHIILHIKLREYLRLAIDILLWKKFEDILTEPLCDDTQCVNAIGPKFEKGLYNRNIKTYKNAKFKCNISNFLNKNKDYLQNIVSTYKSSSVLDHEEMNFKNIVQNYINNSLTFDNCNKCFKIGDVIIALECPADSDLFNNNEKHFKTICSILGKRSISYQQ